MAKMEKKSTAKDERQPTPPEKLDWKQMVEMMLVMAKISCFTFGGGWSILAQMQNEFYEKRGWISQEELMDFASVGRSLPGIMILNITTLFGYRMAGVIGAVAALIGLVFPPLVVICVVTTFYTAIKENRIVAKALIGVRAAVVPIIVDAALKLKEKALVDKITYLIMFAAFGICLFTSLNNAIVVVLGAVAGLLLRGGRKDAVS